MKEVKKNPASKLKISRITAGYALCDAAYIFGFSPGHLANIESGREVIKPELLNKMIELYGCSLSDLD